MTGGGFARRAVYFSGAEPHISGEEGFPRP